MPSLNDSSSFGGVIRRTGEFFQAQMVLVEKISARARARLWQGHSKNPSGYSFDGVVAIFPKVLASFGDRETALADHANCGVS